MTTEVRELATVLRAWRDRLSPEAAGLPAGAGRRTSGLRREELAALAGLSVDYVVRLEQGRASNPSAQVVAAIARALRLTNDERDHLYRVAGAPVPSSDFVPQLITPGVHRIVDRLSDSPVAVFSAIWDTLLFNSLWSVVIGRHASIVASHSDKAGSHSGNLVWAVFVTDDSPIDHESDEYARFRRDLVADLRSAVGRYPRDARLARLVRDLRARSSDFEALWHESSVSQHVSARKTVITEAVGPITLDCDVMSVPGGDLRVVVLTTVPGSEDDAKLDLLRVTGLQSFAVSD